MNSFKPTKQEKIVISIRLDSDTLKVVDEESTRFDMSRNEFIVQCIEYALAHLDEDD